MAPTLQRLVVNVGGKTRREKLEGRWHVVAPTALLERGVIAGSKGPIFYDDPDMESSVPAWNHKPVVVYHPKDDADRPVSGCDVNVLNTRKVGVILNTSHGDKLVTESWFDEERTAKVDRRVAVMLEKGEPIECSTGLYVDIENGEGEYGGQKYVGTARNYRPDHLAVLPDKLGAFPVSKGGGINYVANEAEQPESVRGVLRRSIELQAAHSGIAERVANELSFGQRAVRLTDLLREKYGRPGRYWDGCVVEVYDNRVVFADGEDYTALKMIGYKVGADDSVSLEGDAEKVERVVEYRAASGASYVGNAAGELVLGHEEKPMAFDKKAHVTRLIEAGVASEPARAALELMSEEALQAIPVPEKKETPANNEAPKPAEKPAGDPPKKLSLADLLANADGEALAEVNGWREAAKVVADNQQKERDRLVKTVLANENNAFKEEFLKKCPLPELRGIAALARKPKPADDGVLNARVPTYELGAGVDDSEPLENEAAAVSPLEYN